MPKPRFKLVHFPGSPDTVQALRARLAEAEARELIGIAYVAMYSHREYAIGIEGETRKSPTLTRGMLHVLDDELAKLIRGSSA